jgi:hypothetical protein
MGLEARCKAKHGRRAGEGKALLESDTLIFRGPFKLDIKFSDVKAAKAEAGKLELTFSDGKATFELGAAAARWLDKIKNPRNRNDKLGVKAEHRVSLVGPVERAFRGQLRALVAELCEGKAAKESDLVFFAVEAPADLERLAALKGALQPNGALWILRKKGAAATVSESAVLEAARAAGLVDVKVVAFSPTHTAEKLVIPVAKR